MDSAKRLSEHLVGAVCIAFAPAECLEKTRFYWGICCLELAYFYTFLLIFLNHLYVGPKDCFI